MDIRASQEFLRSRGVFLRFFLVCLFSNFLSFSLVRVYYFGIRWSEQSLPGGNVCTSSTMGLTFIQPFIAIHM